MSSLRSTLPARLVAELASAGLPASPVPVSSAPVASKASEVGLQLYPLPNVPCDTPLRLNVSTVFPVAQARVPVA